MSTLCAFFAARRFNYIDVLGFLLLAHYISEDQPYLAFIAFCSCIILSVMCEQKAFKAFGSRPAKMDDHNQR